RGCGARRLHRSPEWCGRRDDRAIHAAGLSLTGPRRASQPHKRTNAAFPRAAAVVRMRRSRGLGAPRLYECVVPGDRERRDCTNAHLSTTGSAAIVQMRRSFTVEVAIRPDQEKTSHPAADVGPARHEVLAAAEQDLHGMPNQTEAILNSA